MAAYSSRSRPEPRPRRRLRPGSGDRGTRAAAAAEAGLPPLLRGLHLLGARAMLDLATLEPAEEAAPPMAQTQSVGGGDSDDGGGSHVGEGDDARALQARRRTRPRRAAR